MKKGFIYSFICLVLVAVTLPVPVFSAASAGAISESCDYSRPASLHNELLDSAELLEMLIDDSLSDAEYSYLSRYGELKLPYNDGITAEGVNVRLDGSTLSVTALPFTYTAECGTLVYWIPSLAKIGDREASFAKDGDVYTFSFLDFDKQAGTELSILYNFSLTLEKSEINSLLNKAYNDASAIKAEILDKRNAYEEALRLYNENLIAFNEYSERLSEYEAALALYNDYLKTKRLYDERLAEYTAYLSELDAYNLALIEREQYSERLADYNEAYAKYREYLKEIEAYSEKNERYLEYLSQMEIVREHLSALDLTKVEMTDGRDMLSALNSGIVASVVENKDLITSEFADVSEEVVDAAGASTDRLKEMLAYYFTLTSEADRYSYYTVNYEELRDNFVLLLQSLDNLYRNKRVRAELIRQERDKKYIILVAQLYVVSRAMSNGEIYSFFGDYAFDESYKIEKQTPLQILENTVYISDNYDARPLKTGFPEKVKKPKEPEPIAEPERPVLVSVPAKPERVEKPGEAPTPVDEPIPPVKIDTPPTPPEPYTPPVEYTELVAAYDRGELSPREEVGEDKELTLGKSLTFDIEESERAKVNFIGHGGELLFSTEVLKGTPADYVGALPTRPEDESATYSFAAWRDAAGEERSLDAVLEDVTLYADFSAAAKHYKVSFLINGKTEEQILPYGAMPVPKNIPEDYALGDRLYSFSGWDTEISPVKNDVTYTAVFEERFILPIKNSALGAKISRTDGYILAELPAFSQGELILADVLAMAKDEGLGIVIKSLSYKLTISYSSVLNMRSDGVYTLVTSIVQRGVVGYSYSVSTGDKDGKALSGYKLLLEAPSTLTDKANMTFFYNENDTEIRLPFSLENKTVRLNISTGTEYHLLSRYSVNLIPSALAEISSTHSEALPGERVKISVSLPRGTRLERLYLITSEGEREISGGEFTMPSCDVTVGAVVSYIEYKVTFVNDGKVLAVYTYKYGDAVKLPTSPTKAKDKLYSYTFLGWSPEVSEVTGDVTYTAVYKAELLPPLPEPEGLQISDSILRLLIAGAIALGVFTLVVIPALAITIVNLVKIKRRYKKRGKRAK